MSGIPQALLNLIRALFGGGEQAGKPLPQADGAFPADHERHSDVPHDNVPEVGSSAQAARADAASATAPKFTAQAADGCTVTIRPELGTVNLRLGPSVTFEPPLAQTHGGAVFDLVGASEIKENEPRWYAVKLANGSGWVRGDLVKLSLGCADLSFISKDEVTSASPAPPPDSRFPLPTNAPISQGYHPPAHPALDLGVDVGRALIIPAEAVCIRRVECTKCTKEKPNHPTNAMFQCPDTWKDPAWGFGYGNFIVMRHDYARLPAPIRQEMDKRNLRNGFAYVLYAHLSRLNVRVGEQVQKGTAIAATGNTGCSTGPHLHFEVRIGNDENVDNRWSLQRSVHPNLMFDV